MRIAFDGTTLLPDRTGVGYYAEHLLQHLATEFPGDEITVISNRPIDTVLPLPRNVRVCETHQFGLRLAWLQAVAPRVLDTIRPDVAHFTNGITPIATPCPVTVTIHDMTLTLCPANHPLRRVLLKRPLQGLAARRSGAIMTVSHAARRDILRLYGLPADRVHVVHGAPAAAFRIIDDRARLDAVRRRYELPARFVLYVGAIEPRKNLLRLIEAFACARREGDLPHTLVCAGPYGWKARGLRQHIDAHHVAGAVRFLGYVPFDDLPILYNLGEIFAFPSLYEGFGLPVVEAMACGLPVVTARTSSLGELAEGAAEAVDPLDTDALAAAILRLAADGERRRHLRELGLARAHMFSWQRAARQTRDLYRQVAGLPAALPHPALAPAVAGEALAISDVDVARGPAALVPDQGRW
ncbi:MAG TPA: glycosyltransferase family 1 protein [Vicinamibacterales bacterium]|nr:glycosyltransferase family 1 protein [Vicinamibacterales bacterium]